MAATLENLEYKITQAQRSISPIQSELREGMSVFAKLVSRVRRWRELSRQRRELAQLSDDLLKDIGLSRADALREANRPFWDDPQSLRK